ncbi:MAG: hypothetical protein ACYC5F_08195 [Thermoleophilia bacterium]
MSDMEKLLQSVCLAYAKTRGYLDAQGLAGEKESIPPQYKDLVINAAKDALQGGISGISVDDIVIDEYEKYSDGAVAKMVGAIPITLTFVIKVGESELLNQVKRMEESPAFIYPSIFSTCSIEEDRVFACLMQKMPGCSLHESVYKSYESVDVIKGFDVSFNKLKFGLLQHKTEGMSLDDLFIKRMQEYFLRGLENIESGLVELDGSIEKEELKKVLLEGDLIVNGEVVGNFPTLIKQTSDRINSIQSVNTLLHGDYHPANVQIFEQNGAIDAVLLDPSPYITQGDYSYECGKFLHWFDDYGAIKALENEDGYVSVKIKMENKQVECNFQKKEIPTKDETELKEHAEEQFAYLAQEFDDADFPIKKHISIASAIIGGFRYRAHIGEGLLCLSNCMKHLNRALET